MPLNAHSRKFVTFLRKIHISPRVSISSSSVYLFFFFFFFATISVGGGGDSIILYKTSSKELDLDCSRSEMALAPETLAPFAFNLDPHPWSSKLYYWKQPYIFAAELQPCSKFTTATAQYRRISPGGYKCIAVCIMVQFLHLASRQSLTLCERGRFLIHFGRGC